MIVFERINILIIIHGYFFIDNEGSERKTKRYYVLVRARFVGLFVVSTSKNIQVPLVLGPQVHIRALFVWAPKPTGSCSSPPRRRDNAALSTHQRSYPQRPEWRHPPTSSPSSPPPAGAPPPPPAPAPTPTLAAALESCAARPRPARRASSPALVASSRRRPRATSRSSSPASPRPARTSPSSTNS